jgi:hypothetical protein
MPTYRSKGQIKVRKESMDFIKAGKHATYIFNRPVNLRELSQLNFNGTHMHFNGAFNLQDLKDVDLRGTNIVINDYKAAPPCTGCGSRAVADAIPYPCELSNHIFYNLLNNLSQLRLALRLRSM